MISIVLDSSIEDIIVLGIIDLTWQHNTWRYTILAMEMDMEGHNSRIARAQEEKSGGYRYLKIGAIVEVKCDEKTVSK